MTVEMKSRRQLLRQAAWVAGLALLPSTGGVIAASRIRENPFTLGVASGEPTPDGMVLWTRLAPRPLDPDGGMGPSSVVVRWEIALDPGFRRMVRSGRVLATPEAGHSVHVELTGLRSDQDYWYRFMVHGGTSPVGRTRTAPRRDSRPERLRLCFASCQKYESGLYGAYRHMVEDQPDLVLFLGDYIYEGKPGSANAVRLHLNPEPMDVAGYRVRYATYKSDPMLQAAHAVAPWAVIWDDHEVSNDYGGARDQDGGDPVAFLRRRAAAYQAYYEHMPLRRRAIPVGPDMLLYRSLNWGRLAQIQLVDDRQYRSEPVCRPPKAGRGKLISDCDDRRDPGRSLPILLKPGAPVSWRARPPRRQSPEIRSLLPGSTTAGCETAPFESCGETLAGRPRHQRLHRSRRDPAMYAQECVVRPRLRSAYPSRSSQRRPD